MAVPARQPGEGERTRALLAEWKRIQRELAEAQADMTDEEREALIEEISTEIKRNITIAVRVRRSRTVGDDRAFTAPAAVAP